MLIPGGQPGGGGGLGAGGIDWCITWFKFWVNGTQNSGLVNFFRESRLQFVQISSINRQTLTQNICKLRPFFTWYAFANIFILFISEEAINKDAEMCNAAMEEGNPQVILNNYAVFTYYVNTLTYRRKTDTDTSVKQVKLEANLQYIRCVGRQMKGNSC